MEKITALSSCAREKERRLTVIVCRLMAAALLVSGIILVAPRDSARAAAGAPTGYRSASFSAGSNPSAAKIGDLDGDGLKDIAVVNLQGSLQLFFNRGDGTFDRTSLNGLWPLNSSTLGVDIGDLNGDGRNDIAVAFSTQTGALSILFNQGGRTFAAPVNYDLCGASRGVAIGDFDQDGDNDLADISQCSRAGILRNNGQGAFAFTGAYGSGSASKSIVLADFNRDGFKDIAYVNNVVNGSVTVVLNNRNGTFGPPQWLYAGDLPDDIAAGDFDGDGTADIAIANSYYSQIIILFNDGNPGFAGYSEESADVPTSITAADFDGNGRMDLAVTSWSTGGLTILLNQGNYSFARQTFNVGQHPADITAGDLDGDSLPDLVAVNQGSGSITVLFSAGGAPPPPPPPPPPIALAVSTHITSKARLVDLSWSGAATSRFVDLYRNGSRIATVSNTGRYTDQFNRRATGTFRYKVCVAGGQDCSNEASISF